MRFKISEIARKSVVIVADKNDRDAYCSGCVMMKNSTVNVITSSEFVQGREGHLKVVFFDRKEFDATVVSHQDSFCLLSTAFHPACEVINLVEDGYTTVPQRTFMYVPQSRATTRKMSTYATVESLQSYLVDETALVANSANYFMVSCAYFEKTGSGINRLTAAPVFTVLGKTAGIVLQDCRYVVGDPGAEMKVALKATHLCALMMSIGPQSYQGGFERRKRGVTRKRKRDSRH